MLESLAAGLVAAEKEFTLALFAVNMAPAGTKAERRALRRLRRATKRHGWAVAALLAL